MPASLGIPRSHREDWSAAHWLREHRESVGHSPESLAADLRALADAQWAGRGAVDAHTIRRIERHGHIPGPRVRLNLALYFGSRPELVWVPGRQVEVEG